MRLLKFFLVFLVIIGCKQTGQLSSEFTCDPSYDLTLALETDLKKKNVAADEASRIAGQQTFDALERAAQHKKYKIAVATNAVSSIVCSEP